MKIVVIGGTGLIGSKAAPVCARAARRLSRRRANVASIPSPEKGSKKPQHGARCRFAAGVHRRDDDSRRLKRPVHRTLVHDFYDLRP
jgi:nucleoside-diphosphate-sugar epimerase